MGNVLKVLGQVAPAATTLTELYEVPLGTSTTISSIVICNRGAATTFRLSVAVAGAADAPEQYLYYGTELPANDSFVATIGLTLQAGDVIRVYVGTANTSASAYGMEAS